MLLELQLTGRFSNEGWNTERLKIFNEANEQDYIESIPTSDAHLEDWDWVITKKGLEYLEQHK